MTEGDQASQASGGAPERIAKRMARAGLCSRRDAERWIADGRVKLDGEVLTSPAVTVTAASKIEVDGKPLPAIAPARLFRFHKPTGCLTAASDPEGRKTITDLIPTELPRLIPIGRLDMNSEGLLLLTNDGGLKRQLELPTTGWQRRYRVRVHGDVDEAKLASLVDGITIDGFDYGPIEAVLERKLGKNAWLNVALREGKNREIRKVMEHFGWPVNRLIRGELRTVSPRQSCERIGRRNQDEGGEGAGRPGSTVDDIVKPTQTTAESQTQRSPKGHK